MKIEQLRMDKKGKWSHGKPSTRWAIDPSKIQHGWIVVTADGDIVKESLALIHQKRPAKPRRKNTHYVRTVQMQSDVGIVTYHTSSMGGLRATDTLLDAIRERLAANKKFCPVVQLRSMSYTHRNFGTIYAPEFSIVGWTGPTGGIEKPVRPRLAA